MKGEPSFLAVASCLQAHNLAKRNTVRPITREPNHSIMSFDDCINTTPQPRISEEFMICPMHQPGLCSDPETAIAGPQQRLNPEGGSRLSDLRRPWNEPHTIKTDESVLSSDPQVTIRSLCDCVGTAIEESVLQSPDRMSILRDLPTGIDRPCGAAEREQQEPQPKGTRDVQLGHLNSSSCNDPEST